MTLFRKIFASNLFFSRKNYKFSLKIGILLLFSKSAKTLFLPLALLLTIAIAWQITTKTLNNVQPEFPVEIKKQPNTVISVEPRLCYDCCNAKNITELRQPFSSIEEITNQITLLEKDLELSPRNPCLVNNLAVTYFIRGSKTEEGFSDIIQALSLADSALSIEPNLLEALFNRSLFLDNIYLPLQARLAWEVYLKKEKDKNWLREINFYLMALDSKPNLTSENWGQEIKKVNISLPDAIKKIEYLVSISPHQARIYALTELLPNWANSYLANDTKTSYEVLWLIRQIGHNLFVKQKDMLINDLIKTIDICSSNKSSQNNLTDLAKAYLLYQKASKTLENYQSTSMDIEIANALNLFIKLNDEAGEILITLLTTRQERYLPQALNKLEKILLIAEKHSYPYLLGLIWRNIGSFQGQLFQSALAFGSQNKALSYFESCGDLEGVASSHFVISEILSQINDKEEIFFHQKKALSSLSNYSGGSARKALFLAGIGSQLQKLSQPQSAFYFHNEAVSLSTSLKTNVVSSITLLRRSLAYYFLGDKQSAFNDFNNAKIYFNSITESKDRCLIQENINIIEGSYKLIDDPKEAIKLFSLSLNSYEKHSDKYYLTHIYQSLAKAHRVLGNKKLALNNLAKGIFEFEKQRENISEQSQRMSFFEESQSIYEQMVEMQIAENNIKEAFNYLEKARARSLLELINTSSPLTKDSSNTPASPFSILEIQKNLPTNTTIIEYSVMQHQTLAWVVSKYKIDLVKITTEQNNIDQLVKKIRDSIETNDQDNSLTVSSKQLYKLVISPLSKHLPSSANLVIVADKSLNNIPFSILSNPQTGRYLIQDWSMTHAPSATIFIQCLIKDKELLKNDDKSILIIGNSIVDKDIFPDLQDLNFVSKEVQEVKNIYELDTKSQIVSFALILNKKATKAAFFRNAKNYSTIHFAGHGVENKVFPLYSYLVFASSNHLQPSVNNSAMYAYELHKYNFTKTRLAILSSCHTGSGQTKLGEGIISLARSFLAARVPTVIASSWQIDDEMSAEFFIKFHQKKILGQNSLEALCNTQKEFITSQNPKYNSPIIWGAFALLGGSASNR